MHLFYTPEIDGATGSTYLLSEEESKHGVRVLRLVKGDTVYLTDGKGTLWRAAVAQAADRACLLQIEERFDDWGARSYYVHLAVAPTKNSDRYEWMVEKCTEVGVDEITPLIAARSERKVYKTDRIQRIAVSAMKQSLKARLPLIHPAISLEAFMDRPFDGIKLMAHCGGGARISLQEALSASPSHRMLILIGPEGDFSPEEVSLAEAKGFQSIHLGASRLRTETAALTAAIGAYLFGNVEYHNCPTPNVNRFFLAFVPTPE
ncbi:MAG: 16S rRNA (uracil(1498)-N(3))-methyltransferase [Bacteroidetes bacterium]|nr:16S rRNA (uracil(1498)-N(3))-methyltransferase [Bacteroidota bacterium]